MGKLVVVLHLSVEPGDEMNLDVPVDEHAEFTSPLIDLVAMVLNSKDEVALDLPEVSEELSGRLSSELPDIFEGELVCSHAV
jgi:hypothetical protein